MSALWEHTGQVGGEGRWRQERYSGGRKQMASREIADRHGRMSLAVVGIDRRKSRIFIKA